MVVVGRSSDRTLERRYHAAIPLIIGAIALLVLGTTTTTSVLFSVTLWCLAAAGICSLWGPFWSLPNEFLAGFSVALGIALVNSIGNLGSFAGPYAMGVINKKTGSFHGGLAVAGVSLFISAMLLMALPKENESACDERESEIKLQMSTNLKSSI